MKYSRKIKSIIKDIKDISDTYLGFVESANECAATDRLIEAIVKKSQELGSYHEKRFIDLNKDSKDDIEEEIEK